MTNGLRPFAAKLIQYQHPSSHLSPSISTEIGRLDKCRAALGAYSISLRLYIIVKEINYTLTFKPFHLKDFKAVCSKIDAGSASLRANEPFELNPILADLKMSRLFRRIFDLSEHIY